MVQTDQSLGLQLDVAGEPLYRQIFDQVVDRIRNGAFSHGFRLPPSRAFASALGVHRNTVVRAYEALEDGGFVESTVGRGTFVRAPRTPALDIPAAAPGMPWASLVSRAVEAEPLLRFDRLSRRIPGRAAINLNRMQPSSDLLPVKLFRRCLSHVFEQHGARALGYAPREGVHRLREAIAEHLSRRGVPARVEDVLITTGSQQALDLVARALVDPEDPVLVESSTYAGALHVLSAAGARLVGVPRDAAGPDLAVLERLGRVGAKALYLMPDGHNPTGAQIAAERRRALVAWSRRAAVPVIEDAYVSDLYLDDAPPVALRALDGDVLYVGSFSKKLIPALRVGFVLVPPGLLPRLTPLKHAMDLGTSPLLQYALAEFMDRGYLGAHLERMRAEYRTRRDALVAALQKHLPSEVMFHIPSAGLSLFVHLPEGVPPVLVFEAAANEGVLVTPSTLNAVSAGPLRSGGVRLTYCAESPRRLAEGARRLGVALSKVLPRRRKTSQDTALEGI